MTREAAFRLRSSILWLTLCFSGAAGLGYEIVWTRMLSVGLGHEMPSMLAVVAAFFGGMALGAWGFDAIVSRALVGERPREL